MGKFEQGDGNGAGPQKMDSKKSRKYDYASHFQCYGSGNQGFGMMGVPYGYLPTNGMQMGGMDRMGDNSGAAYHQQQDMSKSFMSRLSKLDRYVIKRHSEIYPTEDHLSGVLKLVSSLEEVMKQISEGWNKVPENDIKIRDW